MKNKKGWIKILEAFISIVMLLSMLTLVINYERTETKEVSNILLTQSSFLVKIQENDSLRDQIIGVNVSSGVVGMNESTFPLELKNYIEESFSERIDCYAQICSISNQCDLEDPSEREIYSQSVVISSNLSSFNPRKLSLFCKEK